MVSGAHERAADKHPARPMTSASLAETAARLTAAGFRVSPRSLERLMPDGQTTPDADLTVLIVRLRRNRQQMRRERRAARRSTSH
jgi:uncharacterized protein (DUF849 family)